MRNGRLTRRSTGRAWVLGLFLGLLFSFPTAATAAVPPLLTEFGEWGDAAGQTRVTVALDASPITGHIYMGQQSGKVSEFTAWGEFVRTWGWGVDDGSPELQTCTAETGCQEAIVGAGPGQFGWANGIAVGPGGDVYVFDRQNLRVQKFDAEGHFLLMFGGEVNKTTGEDVCTQAQVEGGDICGAGTNGTAPGEFGIGLVLGADKDYISVAPDGTVYVGDKDRIQTFEPNGSFKAAISLPQPGNPGALAVDPISGDVYFAYNQTISASDSTPNVFRLNAAGSVVDTLEAAVPVGLSVDSHGTVYVLDRQVYVSADNPIVLAYGPSGEIMIGPEEEFASFSGGGVFAPRLTALATNTVSAAGGVDVFTSYTDGGGTELHRIYGPPPEKWAPPAAAPAIEDEHATWVGEKSAAVRAEINPQFWADTSYHLEYGSAPCSEGGCQRVPASGEIPLDAGVVNSVEATDPVELSGLQPDTTYYIRFTAQSSGGGPTVGKEATFRTFRSPVATLGCPNQQFRGGAAAFLPACRAYEMVSPVDKEGGEILGVCNNSCFESRFEQAASSGDGITYSSYRAFPGTESAPWASQYLASRTPEAWLTQPISPPQEGPVQPAGLDFQYKGFLEDLSAGWLFTASEPPLAPGALTDSFNLYYRDLDSGAYQALTTVQPPEVHPSNFFPELQGFSSDGFHAIFQVRGALTPDAHPGTEPQLYDFSGGELHLVSVLPDGTPAPVATAGTLQTPQDGRSSSLYQAVSASGTRIYWSAGPSSGRIYVRINGEATLPVSKANAYFWGASSDGERAVYGEGNDLFRFDLETNTRTELATDVLGVMGMGEDARAVYFVSSAVLAPGGVAEEPNLYLHDSEGLTHYIATLSDGDVSNPTGLSPVSRFPFSRLSRISPDGEHAVFMSQASLTGFDNTDQASGEADSQVFLYDAGDDALRCISCNPTEAQPAGRRLSIRNKTSSYWAAGSIPPWPTQLHPSRVISEDGDRVFFDSFDRLSPRDVNGRQDVYEWARAGSGDCGPARDTYNPSAGGCVSLISDGVAEADSIFVDADPSGGDVFFTTLSSLVPQDPGQRDLYDAREGGGFPAPPLPPSECGGEECQPATPLPPAPPLPGSNTPGPGNPTSKPPKPAKCPKGKKRVKTKSGKFRCVKKKGHGRAGK